MQPKIKLPLSSVIVPLALVLAMWTGFLAQLEFNIDYDWGVRPHQWKGLIGILTSPFLHGDIEHLYSNTLPILILSFTLFYFYRHIAFKVLLTGWLISGLFTWLVGQEGSAHIGASGIVYVLSSFIFFKGLWSKNYRLIAVSLIIIFVYGGLIWGIFPGKEGISWEGHLGGAVAGISLAFFFKNESRSQPEKKFIWEKPDYDENQDPFMQHFDQNGNFVPYSEWEAEEEKEASETQVVYHLVPKKERK
jgi:membrane associated rhomboid family serine protease